MHSKLKQAATAALAAVQLFPLMLRIYSRLAIYCFGANKLSICK